MHVFKQIYKDSPKLNMLFSIFNVSERWDLKGLRYFLRLSQVPHENILLLRMVFDSENIQRKKAPNFKW